MAWFADLSPCTYFRGGEAVLRSVGWLEGDHDFPTGPTAQDVYQKLVQLVRDCWSPVLSCGPHFCSLCQFPGETACNANLFVPGHGILYASPTLIPHYVNAHHYRPPEEFCEAVLRCPLTDTMEYKRLFLTNGGRDFLQVIQHHDEIPVKE